MTDQNNRIYSTMETDGQVVDGCVPVEELKELIDEWHYILDANPIDQHEAGYLSSTGARLDELQELVRKYE